ncbi:hypothetical protein ABI_16820 [Asticcacaulis biprosthecium C19]|uniref:Uncharacterized protein n=2 Tax=Asticcacaulis biprosthecium TaxID=76891 RepID=F4QJY5_9CAUL|nr:hypothetical protein ABI_16820 [Asticcacaulis biprosthecium C19]
MFYIDHAVEAAYVQTVAYQESHCYLETPRKLSVKKSTGVVIYDYEDKGLIKTYQGGYKDAVFTLQQSQCEDIVSELMVALPYWETVPNTKSTQADVNAIERALGLEGAHLSDADFNRLVEQGQLELAVDTLRLSYSYRVVGYRGIFVVEMRRRA